MQFNCDVIPAPHTKAQSGSQFFSHAMTCGNRCLKGLLCSGGRNAAGTPSLQYFYENAQTKQKYEAQAGQWRIPTLAWLRSKQKAKSGAARKRGAYLCFCAAARGRHSNWPPRAEEKAQNAENHQLRQLCETALGHYVLKGSCQSDCIPGELIWNLNTDLTRFFVNLN